MNQPRVGIALVTHNSMPFLRETLESIEPHLNAASALYVVDDYSSDGTTDVVDTWIAHARTQGVDAYLRPSTSSARDTRTRTAQNFTHAVRALSSMDVIALADHDDRWLPDRLIAQTQVMSESPDALYLASNGTLTGHPGTLFEAFDVPADLDTWPCQRIARHVIRHSVATGSASMIRSTLLNHRAAIPPSGWLHDRWWSLLAASQCGLITDDQPVIDYRVSEDQQIGVHRGRQDRVGFARLRSGRVNDIAKVRDLVGLRRNASDAAKNAFSPASVVRTITGRSDG